MEELTYTSAPQGLMPGSSGFCTVEMTDGLPAETMDALESLSAYDGDSSGTVNWMHTRIDTLRGPRHVFSRVSPVQGEFSGRSNKLAHHICVAPLEMPVMGPMQALGPGGPLRTGWNGSVAKLPARTSLSPARSTGTPRPCSAWASGCGDAGVAGAVVDRMRKLGDRPLYLIRTAGMDAVAMMDQMLSLLPPGERAGVTFATYTHAMPRSIDCRLRWVLPGSPVAETLSAVSPDCVIDLRSGAAVISSANASAVKAARQGTMIGSAMESPTPTRSTGNLPPPPTSTPQPIPTAMPAGAIPSSGAFIGNDVRAVLADSPPPMSAAMKWAMVGVVSLLIPLVGIIIFFLARDPAGDLASSTIDPSSFAAPTPTLKAPEKQVVAPEPEAKPEPKKKKKPREKKPDNRETKPKPPPKPPGDKPQTIAQTVRLPKSTLSLARNDQPIFQGENIYDITMTKVAPSADPVAFELSPPDAAGVYDIVSGKEDAEPIVLASLLVEADQVLLAWTPTTKPARAAAFILAHEFLIKDQTHHSTVQLAFADPVPIASPPVPVVRNEIEIPGWLSPEFPMTVTASFYSATDPEEPLVLPELNVTGVAVPVEPKNKSVSIKTLEDPWIKSATFSAAAALVGTPAKRTMIFASQIDLKGGDKTFPWKERRDMIEGNTRSKNKNDGVSISARDRIETIEAWADGLWCELQCTVDTGTRKVVWAKTPRREEPKQAQIPSRLREGGAERPGRALPVVLESKPSPAATASDTSRVGQLSQLTPTSEPSPAATASDTSRVGQLSQLTPTSEPYPAATASGHPPSGRVFTRTSSHQIPPRELAK